MCVWGGGVFRFGFFSFLKYAYKKYTGNIKSELLPWLVWLSGLSVVRQGQRSPTGLILFRDMHGVWPRSLDGGL